MPRTHAPPPGACAPGLEVSPGRLLQNRYVQSLIGHDLLQPSILTLQILQSLRLVYLQTPVLPTPPVVGMLMDSDLAAHFRDRLALRQQYLGLPKDWYGIVVNGGGRASLKLSELGYGVRAVRADSAAVVTIDSCNIHHGSKCGVYARKAAGLTIDDSNIHDHAHAGIWVRRGSATVEGTTIAHNDTFGVHVGGIASPEIRSSVFRDNPISIRTASMQLDLGDMTSPGPGNAGWNVFTGDDTCVSNTSAGTVSAEGNYWGTEDAASQSGRIGSNVDYTPWLPVPPDTISITASYAQVDTTGGRERFIQGLCPAGDGLDSLVIACVVKDKAGAPVAGLDSTFMFLTFTADTLAPPGSPCPTYKPTTHDSTTFRLWCVRSDTLFACQSTDSTGTGRVIQKEISGWARFMVTLHVGPWTMAGRETLWVNSFDFTPLPPDGVVNLSDHAAFSAAITRWNSGEGEQTWYCDFAVQPGDSCVVDEEKQGPAFGISLGDMSAFSAHLTDTTTCGSGE